MALEAWLALRFPAAIDRHRKWGFTMSDKKSNRRHSGRPTVSDVARFAQCSPMTVSRVINGHPSVRAEAREAVEAAIKALNYAPNRAARSLAGAGQIRIALLYTNPSAAYLSALLLGCLDEASRADVHLVVERCAFGEDEKKPSSGRWRAGSTASCCRRRSATKPRCSTCCTG
jgi:hypothetical protein